MANQFIDLTQLNNIADVSQLNLGLSPWSSNALINTGNNNIIIGARNAANTADLPVIATDSSNNINIGDLTNTVTTSIYASTSVVLNAGGYSIISGASGGLVYGGNSVYIGFNSAPNLLQFSQSATSVGINQATSTSGSGVPFTIQAQYAKAGSAAAGGNLILQAGGTDSTSNAVQEGYIQLYGGPNQIGQFSITSGASANDCRFTVGSTASYFLFSATQNNQGIIFQSYGAGSNYVSFQTPVVKFADSSLAETLDINLNATGTTSIVATAGVTAFKLGQAQSTSGAGTNLTVYAQNAKSSSNANGGSLVLQAGLHDGSGVDGYVQLANGSGSVLAQFGLAGFQENSTSVSIAAGGTITLTAAQYSYGVLRFTGTLASNTTVVFPAIDGAQWIVDASQVNLNSKTISFKANGTLWNSGTATTAVYYLMYLSSIGKLAGTVSMTT